MKIIIEKIGALEFNVIFQSNIEIVDREKFLSLILERSFRCVVDYISDDELFKITFPNENAVQAFETILSLVSLPSPEIYLN